MNSLRHVFAPAAALGMAALSTASPASAASTAASSAGDFAAPTAWQRGVTPDSTYALWDNSFTSLTSNAVLYDGTNLAAANVVTESPSTLTGWNVADANPGTVTSDQHLYGGSSTPPYTGNYLALSVTVPNYGLGSGYSTDIRLQTEVATLAPDATTFAISADGGPAVPVTPTVTTLPSSGSSMFTDLYEFTVPGNADDYVITFDTPTSGTNFGHTALYALSVDTAASVPEPTAAAALGGVGAAGLLLRRRRRCTTA